MNKSLLAAALLAVALSACNKKEEVAATQPAPVPAVAPAPEPAAPANLSAQVNAAPPAPAAETGTR